MENLNLILKKISLFLNNLPFDQSYLKHIFNLENEKNPLVILLINTFSQKLSKSNEENTFYFIVFTLIIVTKVFEEDEYFKKSIFKYFLISISNIQFYFYR